MIEYKKPDSIRDMFRDIYFSIYRRLHPRIRFGKTYWETYKFLQESQWWSKEQINEYQLKEIRRLVTHASKSVPYYTKLFNENGIDATKIQDFEDFKKIPYLTKELINQNKELLKSNIHPISKLEPTITGGTSGKTINFWIDPSENIPREKAAVWRMWNMLGYNWGDKSVIIKAAPGFKSKSVYYQAFDKSYGIYNPIFSSDNVKKYCEIISEIKPVVIRAYPSLIYSLAYLIIKNDCKIEIPSLRFIYCQSEKMLSFQKETIENVFNVKAYSQYGHTERCVFMQPCKLNDDYHILPEYGYTEFIPNPDDSSLGEIVGTGFNNYAFPFIRYRTRDMATIPKADFCVCGRNFQLVRHIIGRSGDFIITPSGGFVSPTILESGRKLIDNYKDILIVQHDERNLEIQIVPEQGYSNIKGNTLKDFIQKRIGEPVAIQIKLVESIPRTGSNKKRFVISEIADQYFNNIPV